MLKKVNSLFIFLLYVLIGFLAYYLNRLVVFLFWPVLSKENSVFATSVNFAILTPVYTIFFLLLGMALKANSNVLFKKLSQNKKDPFSRKIYWMLLKTSLTPLEQISIGAAKLNSGVNFYVVGLAQITFGHLIFMGHYLPVTSVYLVAGFLLNAILVFGALHFTKYSFDDSYEFGSWSPNVRKVALMSIVLPFYYLLIGIFGNWFYLKFSSSLVEKVSLLLQKISGSTEIIEKLPIVFVDKFFLTERIFIFKWAEMAAGSDLKFSISLFFLISNFFNFHSLFLIYFLIFFWNQESVILKLKKCLSITAVGFCMSHLIFFFSLFF